MRVLLLTHYYPPEVGAPQRRWDGLVGATRSRGHVVTVVTAVPHYPHGRAPVGAPRGRGLGRHGETVVRVPYLRYDSGRGRRSLDQLVVALGSVLPALRARPDVVVATVPGLPTLPLAVLVAGARRVPLVLEMRDAWPDLLVDADVGPRCLRRPVARVFSRLQRRATTVVSVSGDFAARLRARGLPRVVHVPNGADLAAVPARAGGPPVRAPGEPLRVVYVGTVGESQGLDQAVRALAHLPGGSVDLRVVGHGAGLPALRRAVTGLPRPADVELSPPVAPSAVAGLVQAADTVLVCLRDWPAFEATVPSKLYEAMALGVHVSAMVAGEAARLVRDAGAGHVVAPGDDVSLARLWGRLGRDRTALDVGPGGRAWVAAHRDAAVLAERYVDLIEDVAR